MTHMYTLAFAGIESQEPGFRPLLLLIEIFLQFFPIIFSGDMPINVGVVSKHFYTGVDILRQLSFIDDKQDWS